jgi:hypothetical protein
MANFGTRLAYPTPQHPTSTPTTPARAAARSAERPAARPLGLARARRSLRRLVGLWASGLARGAAPSSLPGWAAPTTYLPGRPATDAGAGRR